MSRAKKEKENGAVWLTTHHSQVDAEQAGAVRVVMPSPSEMIPAVMTKIKDDMRRRRARNWIKEMLRRGFTLARRTATRLDKVEVASA